MKLNVSLIIVFFAVIGLVCGLVFANAVVASPEICNLIPALISPETCVAVQNGKVGTLVYLASTFGGLFSGAILGGSLSIFYVVISKFLEQSKEFEELKSRPNHRRNTFR